MMIEYIGEHVHARANSCGMTRRTLHHTFAGPSHRSEII